MDLQTQIKLVNDLVNQRKDRTIRDFIRIRGEMEKWDPSMQRLTQNITDNEKAPVATRAIN